MDNEKNGIITPEERIYPLNFVCEYVLKKKNDLVNEEAQTVRKMLDMQDQMELIIKQANDELDALGDIPEPQKKAIQSIIKKQADLKDELCHAITKLTEKGFIFENMNNMLQQTRPLIDQLIFRDNLTESKNRYFFLTQGPMLLDQSKRFGLSLAYIDIDDFKNFNSLYGHEFGDEVLKNFVHLVINYISLIPSTYIVRLGGDEFLVMSNYFSYSEFISPMETIREAVEEMRISFEDQEALVNISIGCANSQVDMIDDIQMLSNCADERLYHSKDKGKNSISYKD